MLKLPNFSKSTDSKKNPINNSSTVQHPQERAQGETIMQWFYLITLAVALGMTAKSLWKVEQVLSIAALLTGLISFVWAFITAPSWGQLVITILLFSIYSFQPPTFSKYMK
jgi:hypothetical protein